MPVLAALVFLVGAGEAFFRPAFGALLPTVLPADDARAGNALSSASQHVALVVGPGLAGAAPAGDRAGDGVPVDAATFAVSLGTLLRVGEPPHAPAPRRRVGQEVAEGVRAVLDRPWVGAVLLMATVQLLLVVAPVHRAAAAGGARVRRARLDVRAGAGGRRRRRPARRAGLRAAGGRGTPGGPACSC